MGDYSAVFVGEVIAVTPITVSYRGTAVPVHEVAQKLVVLEVSRVWAGPKVAAHAVYTGFGGPDCGFNFELGGRYVVFADRLSPGDEYFGSDDTTLFTSVCSPTLGEQYAADLMESLNEQADSWVPNWTRE